MALPLGERGQAPRRERGSHTSHVILVTVPQDGRPPRRGARLRLRAGRNRADVEDLGGLGAALRGAGEVGGGLLVGRVNPQVGCLGRAAGAGREVQRVDDLEHGVGGCPGGSVTSLTGVVVPRLAARPICVYGGRFPLTFSR